MLKDLANDGKIGELGESPKMYENANENVCEKFKTAFRPGL
jgi:hypothetical protein